MKADPSAQLKLLEVQELDSRLDALRHQASHPPEGPELRDLESSRTALRDQAADLQIQVDDLTRAQRKADDDVEQVKARRVRDQQRLDSGAVTSPKDLERLQHELVSLDRRIGGSRTPSSRSWRTSRTSSATSRRCRPTPSSRTPGSRH